MALLPVTSLHLGHTAARSRCRGHWGRRGTVNPSPEKLPARRRNDRPVPGAMRSAATHRGQSSDLTGQPPVTWGRGYHRPFLSFGNPEALWAGGRRQERQALNDPDPGLSQSAPTEALGWAGTEEAWRRAPGAQRLARRGPASPRPPAKHPCGPPRLRCPTTAAGQTETGLTAVQNERPTCCILGSLFLKTTPQSSCSPPCPSFFFTEQVTNNLGGDMIFAD